MAEGNQQQQQQQAQRQQQQGQQQLSPTQRLGRALADIRKVQHLMELNYPGQGQAINMLREMGMAHWLPEAEAELAEVGQAAPVPPASRT